MVLSQVKLQPNDWEESSHIPTCIYINLEPPPCDLSVTRVAFFPFVSMKEILDIQEQEDRSWLPSHFMYA